MGKQEINLLNGVSGAALAIKVIPEYQNNEIVRVEGDGLVVIGLESADSDSNINQSLRDYLSDLFQIPRSSIDILSGWARKEKLVSIINTDAEEIQKYLNPYIK